MPRAAARGRPGAGGAALPRGDGTALGGGGVGAPRGRRCGNPGWGEWGRGATPLISPHQRALEPPHQSCNPPARPPLPRAGVRRVRGQQPAQGWGEDGRRRGGPGLRAPLPCFVSRPPPKHTHTPGPSPPPSCKAALAPGRARGKVGRGERRLIGDQRTNSATEGVGGRAICTPLRLPATGGQVAWGEPPRPPPLFPVPPRRARRRARLETAAASGRAEHLAGGLRGGGDAGGGKGGGVCHRRCETPSRAGGQ